MQILGMLGFIIRQEKPFTRMETKGKNGMDNDKEWRIKRMERHFTRMDSLEECLMIRMETQDKKDNTNLKGLNIRKKTVTRMKS